MKKSEFVVGVDADGVLTDMYQFYLDEGQRFFKKPPVNPDAYGFVEMYNVTKTQKMIFGLSVLERYCKKAALRKNADVVINKLKDEGCEMHEITARMFTTFKGPFGGYYRHLFRKYLDTHKLMFDSIQFCSETDSPRDKYMACLKLDVDVMVEDKPEVALFLAEKGIKILLFDAPYNKDLKHENITRVYSWDECYDHINKMKKEKKPIKDFEYKSSEVVSKMSNDEKIEYFSSYKYHIKNLVINTEAIKRDKRHFKLVYNLTRVPFKIIFRAKTYGKEYIPYQDGFIIASNHLNSYDQFYISNVLGNRQFYGFAAESVKGTIRGKLFELTGSAVFIDRNDSISKRNGEIELANKVVNDNIALIFPEGTRKNVYADKKDKLQLPFKFGTVAMAQKTGAAILPVSLHHGNHGSYIRFGDLFFVEKTDDLNTANKKLEEIISNMTLLSIEEDAKKDKKEKVK